MSDLKTKGIILRKTNFGDNDVIFDIINDEGKIIGFFARGARKMKSRFSGVIQLGMVINISYANGKNLNYPSEISIDSKNLFSFYSKSIEGMNFYTDVITITKVISKDFETPELFEITLNGLKRADNKDDLIEVYNLYLANVLNLIDVNTELISFNSGEKITETEFYYIPSVNKVFAIDDKPKSIDAERISFDKIFYKNYLKNLLFEHVNNKIKLKF